MPHRRDRRAPRLTLIAALALAGCAGEPLLSLTPGGGDVLRTSPFRVVGSQSTALDGRVSGDGDYRLFDLGAAQAGDRVTVVGSADVSGGRQLILALFDADMNVLVRAAFRNGVTLRFTLPRGTDNVVVGVAADGAAAARFSLTAGVEAGDAAPAPQPQRVYLNFIGAEGVRVADRPAASFGPLEGSVLGESVAGQTGVLKAAIVATVRQRYAGYNVEIYSSDSDPPPVSPYSTIYFGGADATLLGQADSVDRGNANPADNAIVFVEAFARYQTMRLDAEGFGRMIGNSAAHELGHLLGLYHTHGVSNLMDTSGNAFQIAGERTHSSEPLAPDVFPVGSDNGPRVLAETVGAAPVVAALPVAG